MRSMLLALVALAAVLAATPATGGLSAAPSGCPRATKASTATEAAAALTRLIPQTYANTPWQDYIVTALFSLGPDRDPTMPKGFRNAAVRACGTAVADDTWVALISFPRVQGVDFSGSAAYLASTQHGWLIWRRTVRRGT